MLGGCRCHGFFPARMGNRRRRSSLLRRSVTVKRRMRIGKRLRSPYAGRWAAGRSRRVRPAP
ncbi:hypothetical protein Pd630_LPD02106 [Rhodococcus opacus PD630]|nr:hypothetical protein Pd630_LPD02106 [Rhodococcus opacus PD630]